MKITKPRMIHCEDNVKYQVDVKFRDREQILWYSVDKEFEDLLSNKSDAAAVALLIPSMIVGEGLYIQGNISHKLLYNISGPLQNVLKIVMPELNDIHIEVENISSDKKKADGVATGFSAGVDSYHTLYEHFFQKDDTAFGITHLFFNDVGQHGTSKKLFHDRYSDIKPVAEKIGLPLIKVDSNLDQFYRMFKGYHFRRTHTYRNTSVALLLQKGVGRFLYSSDMQYRNVSLRKKFSASYSDAISLPLLSTDTLDTIFVGADFSRVEKTIKISQLNISHNSLAICLNGHKNCSTCRKCLRTLLTLEIEGCINNYSDIFDLELYSRERTKFIAKVLSINHPFHHELRAFMKEKEFKIPLVSRMLAILFPLIPFRQVKRAKRIFKRHWKQRKLSFK